MYPERHWRKLQGETINNQYHLQEYLGCGGYGAVYKADEVIRNRLIREIAIKLIAPEEDETKAEKQLIELTAAVNLQHENLIRSYTAGPCEIKDDEYLFIVMEIATTTLEKQRKTGLIPPAEAREIVKATAAALNYLHNSNPRKVHRDIKPANLLYAADKWKLSDFGLLREISAKNSGRTSDRRGTTLYVPPEAYEGVVATGWDMWSLGIMTAEILTGTAPFTADTEAQLMKKIMEEEPEIDWSKIPEPFTAIVRGCLKKERENRWTAEQVLTALTPSPQPKPVPSPELTVPSPELTVPSPERSRRGIPDPDRIDQLLASISAPTPEPKPVAAETTRVVSAVGMDYINLRNLLAAKKWKEADEETARVMLKVAGREKEGWLNTESIDKFPCEDLRTIDQLWVKYSNGRFGFSVQKRIYQSLGGTRKYDEKVWEAFGDQVGWRKKNEWLYYNDLTFSEKAPEAHLPCRVREEDEVGWGMGLGWFEGEMILMTLILGLGGEFTSSLASRLVDCNI
ncbi:MAG: serine/threonine-protein kinase [Microcoleus sp.]